MPRPNGDDYEAPQLQWIDRFFKNTNIVLLLIFAFCCQLIALVFGIVGLATCKDADAKQRALIVTIIAAVEIVLGGLGRVSMISMRR